MKAFLYCWCRVGLLVNLQEVPFKCVAVLLGFAFAGAPWSRTTARCSAKRRTQVIIMRPLPRPALVSHHGHDHGIVGVAASSDAAVVPSSPLAPSVWMLARDIHGSNSPPGTFLRGIAFPLRV